MALPDISCLNGSYNYQVRTLLIMLLSSTFGMYLGGSLSLSCVLLLQTFCGLSTRFSSLMGCVCSSFTSLAHFIHVL